MENIINLSDRPELPEGYFSKKIKSYHILTHPRLPLWTLVNELGWQIVTLLDGKRTVREIIDLLKKEYSVETEALTGDVCDFLKTLKQAGFSSDNIQPEVPCGELTLRSLFLHLTGKCNLACRHCYACDLGENQAELTDDEIIELTEQFYAQGGQVVALSGGEPLLRRELVLRIAGLKQDAKVRILTNGTLVDAEFAQEIAPLPVDVQVSLDGSNESVHDKIRGKGSFAAALSGIENLVKAGLASKTIISVTVLRQNFSDLSRVLDLARRLGVRTVRFLPLRKKGRAREGWEALQKGISSRDYEAFHAYVLGGARADYPELKISSGLTGYVLDPGAFDREKDCHWCSVGRSLVVDPAGNAYPCALFMDDEHKLGNIRNCSLNELKKSPGLTELVDTISQRRHIIKKCRACMWKHFCQAGCMGLVHDRCESVWEPDAFCEFKRRLYEASVEKMSAGKGDGSGSPVQGDCF